MADLLLDRPARRLWRGSGEIELPGLSFDLLDCLARGWPQVLSPQRLMDEVAGAAWLPEELLR